MLKFNTLELPKARRSTSEFTRISSIDTDKFKPSYFVEALMYEDELNESIREIGEEFLTAIKEDTDIDTSAKVYFDNMKTAIVKYTARYNADIYNHFITIMERRLSDDKRVYDKFESQITHFNGTVELDNQVFKFSNLTSNNFPNSSIFDKYITERAEMDNLLTNNGNNAAKAILTKEYNKISTFITSGKCYNSARGAILNSAPINCDKFPTAIFNSYRSGGKMYPPTASASDVKMAYARQGLYRDALRSLRDQKKIYTDTYRYIIDHLNDYDLFQAKSIVYDDDVKAMYSVYSKIKADQLMHYCALYVQALNGKMDAIAQSYIQDRDILTKACGFTNAVVRGDDISDADYYDDDLDGGEDYGDN